ncbi:RodZ domain-containing protein [Marinobacterium marinum]|uniref:Helix-turn-helix domain-containing protein n=1 Tax=Marinobacterium marinum TaxID=2756129 RepID=A0A7W1X0D1_9GAMM|nr:RodZ family helix-turn-helix domain-containing protein [Marinobacterium marinum]MBA4503491.1 helix-turn-helix domain-containing protein [Marinobacterium marinum]
MSDENEVTVSPVVFSGQAFSEAREALGLSVEQVARQLHFSENIIETIEKGHLDQFKDPVFSRGYIRTYARFLKLDADAWVERYNQHTGNVATTAQVRAIGSVSTVPGRRQGHPVLKVGSWLFVLALVAASIWWWQTQFGFDVSERAAVDDQPVSVETSDGTTLMLPQLSDEESEKPLAETPAVGSALEQATEPDEIMAPLGDSAVAEPVSVDAALETDAEAPVQADVTEAASTADVKAVEPLLPPGLNISFADDCWLSVKDAHGRSLYSGVAKGGSSLELEGDEPLAVVIGRVDAVASISYADTSIDLASIAKNNVARLRLPQ